MVAQAYSGAVGLFTGVTVNAMNVWVNLVGVAPDADDTRVLFAGITLRELGLALFAVAVLCVCAYIALALRREGADPSAVLLGASAAVNFAFFMLPTEIHERYGIPALVFAIFAVMKDKRWTVAAVGLTVTTLINLVVVLQKAGGNAMSGGFGGNGGGGGTPQGGGFGFGGGANAPSGWERIGGFVGVGGKHMGSSNVLTAGDTWVAAINVMLLAWMFWLLWRDLYGAKRRGADIGGGLLGPSQPAESTV